MSASPPWGHRRPRGTRPRSPRFIITRSPFGKAGGRRRDPTRTAPLQEPGPAPAPRPRRTASPAARGSDRPSARPGPAAPAASSLTVSPPGSGRARSGCASQAVAAHARCGRRALWSLQFVGPSGRASCCRVQRTARPCSRPRVQRAARPRSRPRVQRTAGPRPCSGVFRAHPAPGASSRPCSHRSSAVSPPGSSRAAQPPRVIGFMERSAFPGRLCCPPAAPRLSLKSSLASTES